MEYSLPVIVGTTLFQPSVIAMNVLSTEQRRFVIQLYSRGEHTQASLADLVGTTQSNISKMLSRARRRDPSIPKRHPRLELAARGPRIFAASQVASFDLDSF
jgi:DNA-binding MarR family transcriptional regulator